MTELSKEAIELASSLRRSIDPDIYTIDAHTVAAALQKLMDDRDSWQREAENRERFGRRMAHYKAERESAAALASARAEAAEAKLAELAAEIRGWMLHQDAALDGYERDLLEGTLRKFEGK